MNKPALSFWQIWNMCFGFMGIQFGFALQNANVSRIFQSLGASIDELPILWLAAPVTGLIVQPIIGYLSDRTWNRLGRRRPYLLYGALFSTAALIVMPNSPTLWIAAGMLWILDASINVSMEPTRALVGDMLPNRQRALGYSMQSWFVGIGAIVASALPWLLTNVFDVANMAADGEIPDTVRWSFYLGAIVFLGAVGWTILRTREYSPEKLQEFETAERKTSTPTAQSASKTVAQYRTEATLLVPLGIVFAMAILFFDWAKELLVLAVGLSAFGALQLYAASRQTIGQTDGMIYTIVNDFFAMPRVMKQLAVVQFLTWFALFAMWIYTTPGVTAHHYGATEVSSQAYNDGADWVGVLFAAYNGFAALAALTLAPLATRLGRRGAHLVCLSLGGVGLISFVFIDDPTWLLLPMVGVGFAWASILSMPYAMLAGALPAAKMGLYMGVFNIFIVIPQILAATLLGLLLRNVFDGEAIYLVLTGGVLLLLAGLATLRVDDRDAEG
jgi:maltose/moltooligosaccharide transporter